MTAKFIDISNHNNILSFNALIEANLKGVVIKATEGTTYQDPELNKFYEKLNGSVPIGFYHYLTSSSEPETQAQNFWEQIKYKEYAILPVLDVEQDSLRGLAESYSNRFLAEFYKLSGQEMMIYSGRCYIEENFTEEFKSNNVWWVADYGANDVPVIDGCKIVAWQYTEDCQSYAFASGNLDCNILIDEDSFYLENYVPYSDEPPDYEEVKPEIATLQSELNKQGFRDKNGNILAVDGVAGELTLSACPILKTGAKGMITQWVQLRIGVKADGIFGEQTRQAVIEFQENMSLDGDGIVGKNTWRKLLGL